MEIKFDLSVYSTKELGILYGEEHANMKYLEEQLNVKTNYQDGSFLIQGENGTLMEKILNLLLDEIVRNKELSLSDVRYIVNLAKRDKLDLFKKFKKIVFAKTYAGKQITPKTSGQLMFVEKLKEKAITFAIGPAGTGKTFLAVAYACTLLKKGEIKRIILTRPAVEAGENLGFLPGDLKEKVDPYLQPLYDYLNEMLGVKQAELFIERKIIEVAPLAYMRGRTLADAFIILDEAQNATKMQIKMFLTRLGENSKMAITGDVTQIDLKNNQESGLVSASRLLNEISEIGFVNLTSKDIVRHPLVQKIIDAYESKENHDN